MKRVAFSKSFIKSYKRRIATDKKLSDKFDDRFTLFQAGRRGAPLNDHPLKNNMKGLRAFSVTGDIRVIYQETATAYVFKDIGGHAQVYK